MERFNRLHYRKNLQVLHYLECLTDFCSQYSVRAFNIPIVIYVEVNATGFLTSNATFSIYVWAGL